MTENARELVDLIRNLTLDRGRITVLQVVEIYKGCDLKKIRESGELN